MAKLITGKVNGGANLFHAIRSSLSQGTLGTIQGTEGYGSFASALDMVSGQEGAALKSQLSQLNASNFDAFAGALRRKGTPASTEVEFRDAIANFSALAGNEGFSLQNEKGSEQDIKAVNLTLNAQSHRQTAAAEALFKTITVNYEDDGAELVVRAAGLGNYVYGASAWQSASELRPIFGLLRTGEMFKDEVLALYPVYPTDANDDNRELFAEASFTPVKDATYPQGDAYGRQGHKTQQLKVPVVVPNLLGLCQAPGQRAWTSTDEIESNSITVRQVGVTAKIGAAGSTTDASFFINTGSMSNNTFGPLSTGQSSDDRGLNAHIRDLPAFSVVDKDGNPVGETLFADWKAAGYEPMLTLTLSGNFQRQTNELRLNPGSVTITALRDIPTGNVISIGKSDATTKPLFKRLTAGVVASAHLTFNVSNTSNGNFGYRIEVYDARKHLSVRRRSPVSVKYPVSKDDVNSESLDYAIQQMSVVINNQCSKDAFDEAEKHLEYITSINNTPVVGNHQGSNILPGQHFVTATAVNRKLKLADVVSAVGNNEIFDAVCAAIINEVADITAALNTKSGLAAISEYGNVDKLDWTVVTHQNLARFFIRSGDARTIGGWDSIKVEATNFDSMIGKILIVPRNTSNDDSINPLGGIGVNISKENIVVQGNVTRDQQDFGVVMTMPTYRHWPICPVIGSLIIEDADKLLTDEGLISQLAKLRVQVANAADIGSGAGAGTDPNA